jgi:hypothetical protein
VNKLVLHHTYAHGLTFDVSNHLNHGQPVDVTPGTGGMEGSFAYSLPSSRITVRNSHSLADLGAIRVETRFFLDPPGNLRRYNLMEGFVAFAFVITPDRALAGTIVDADGAWRGATSPAGVVQPGRWHQATMTHDGVAKLQIHLDGVLVASELDIGGPVRSVGDLGITIGSWPDAPAYTFDGHIGEVKLFKYDPREEVSSILDPCCIDTKLLRELVDRLSDDGHDGSSVGAHARDLLQFSARAVAAMRAGDPGETEQQERNSTEAMNAFLRRDAAGVRAAFTRMIEQAQRTLSQEQLEHFGLGLIERVERSPIGMDQAQELARALCWEDLLVPAQDLHPETKRRGDDRPENPDVKRGPR